MTTAKIEAWLLNNDDIYPSDNIPSDTRQWLQDNIAWLRQNIAKNANDAYWQQVRFAALGFIFDELSCGHALQIDNMLAQMEGLVEGFNEFQQPNSTIQSISFNDVYAINAQNSIGDINTALSVVGSSSSSSSGSVAAESLRTSRMFLRDKCSALVRFVDDELYLAHDTWSDYNQMLRILKVYDFKFLGVVNTRVAFTSYPATVWSSDDFYSMGALAVVETTGDVYDLLLWNFLTPESVLTFLRTMLSNRLAASCAQWVDFAKRFNSGVRNMNRRCSNAFLFFKTLQNRPTTMPGFASTMRNSPRARIASSCCRKR